MVKSKRQFFAVIFALFAAMFALTACVGHEHELVYRYEADGHWQMCSDCGETTEKEEHAFGDWTTSKEATCAEAGAEDRVCSVCGAKETRVIDALGHDFGAWTVKTPATHFEKGEEVRVCSRGDQTETRDLDVVPHAFGEELFYESSDGAVVSYAVCACGEKSGRKPVPNAVIATPETAQDVLDRAADGALIYFAAGAYDQPLYLRQNKYASKVKKNHADPEYLEISGLNKTGVYCYYRTVQNLTLYGGENAVFTNKITFGSGHVYGVAGMTYPQNFDAVREVPLQSVNTSYYSYLYVDGLTLKNMKFSGIHGVVDVAMQMADTHLNDFTVDGCEFDASSVAPAERGTTAAIHFITDLGGNYKNITLKNTKIDGYFQGIYVQNAENVSCVGNTIRNTTHNAVAVQSNDLGFSGGVTIRDNRFERIGDRAIRFGVGKNADIVVENNVFVEVDDPQLLKSQALNGCRYSFRGNVYGDPGTAIADVTGTGAAFVVARP